MRKRPRIFFLLLVSAVLSLTLFSLAFASAPPEVGQADKETPQLEPVETSEITVAGVSVEALAAGPALLAPEAIPFFYESEPNGTPATANALPGTQVVVYGNIWPVGDLDYFSFTGNAGDRVYAATMTAFAAGATDTTLTLFGTDGTTVIEVDVNDGSFAPSSSSIAGATLPASGTYYLQVRATSATSSMRPYHLYLKVWGGAPLPETEPNDLGVGGQPIPGLGWVSGVIDPAGDNDVFTFNLLAGDTVFLSLDLDPARVGGTTWNGRLGLGPFGNPPLVLVVDDANTTSPNSEAFFFTVKESGLYYAYVDHSSGTGAPTQTYYLSAVRFPAVPATANCTTYTSTDVPLVIPTGPALVESTLTVPGNPRIADLDVTIVLTHTNMPDLDVVLLAPGGNQVVLFNDIGVNTQQQMNMTLDDEAAIPAGSYTAVSGMVYQPPNTRRLDWFDGQNAGGVWTLQVYDDLASNGGVLQSWSMTICEPPPPPLCPAGTTPVTVFSSDFEANNGGFTSSGVQNEWQWGTPAFAPITTCNSGTNCWVTDLTGTYNASSNQDLFSPAINLSGYVGPIRFSWAQKYQIENANWDNSFVDVQLAGGGSPQRVWEWLGPTMSNFTVGSPTVTVPQSAGWGTYTADISGFAGQNIELRFNLSSDSTLNFAGLAIDDVTVTACQPEVSGPAITLSKTVGTNPSVCATTDEITVAAGTEVTYCYEVTNTGDVALSLHDLADSELGTILSGLPYTLVPGASAFLTQTATINATTVNTATWTAYNPGPTDVATATDTATVNVTGPSLFCNATPISIPSSGAATPYPSDVLVSGLATAITDVNVYLYDMNHTWPDDIDILLVGPQGQNLIIMSDAGGSFDLVNVNLVFDDAAAGPLPDSAQIVSGTYLPTNWVPGDTFPAPAPAPSTATQLAVFNGTNPNGTWSLYVVDDTGGDLGNINGGWCVGIAAATAVLPPNINVNPLSLSATQQANTTTQQTLAIGNTGEADLTWAILEAPAVNLRAIPESFSEGFDDITTLPGLGWFFQNNSQPIGTTGWFQGNDGVFPAHSGAANSYIAANFNNGASVATISNWMLTPEVSLADGDTFSFWTRTVNAPAFPDRLEVRLSLAGASTNVGTTATSVGDFTTLLLTINPDLTTTGYPNVWTQYTVTLSGIPGGATGRFGFRYFVTNGGPSGSNSDYIGIDTVEFTSAGPGGPCDNPADVPWLSASPANGTTAGGASTPVQVTFDSTGLADGTYNANLCVTSNDPDAGPGNGTNLVIVPVELEVVPGLNAAINLTKTVGTVPGVCATTDEITVGAGTTVYYCYVVENTGDVTLNFHDLVDSELGTILNDFPFALAPGAFSPEVIVPQTVVATVTNTATWTAVTALGDYIADDTIPFNWEDISGTGTPVTLTDDSVSGALPLGFSFEFYGTGYSSAYASSNGFLTFASGSGSGCCTGQALPNPAAPNNLIAGWWEDLNPSAGGTVHYQTLGTAPNRVFIVQYTDVPHYPSGNLVSKQYKLFEGSNVIEVHYLAAPSDGGTHSAGIENATGTLGLQYYLGTAGLPTPLAVRYSLTTVASASDTDTATVNVLVQNIDVDPLSLSSTQPANTVTNQTLTIANTGQGTLDWNIAEEPTARPGVTAGGNAAAASEEATAATTGSRQVAAAAPELSSWRYPEAVLYDNGPLITHPGGGAGGADVSALQTALAMSTFGFGNQLTAGNRVADDFTVTGGGWFIDTITFFGYQTGSSTASTFTAVNLRIWDGPPNLPTSSVVFGDTTTNRMISSTWSNIYRTLDTSLGATDRPIMANVTAINTFLPAGTYWVDWQADGTLASGPWAPPISILGQTTTGNAQQFTTAGGWANLIDTGSGTPQGLPFIIEGSSDCANLTDVPWLSVAPTSGSNAGGTSTPVTVSFDSTGLADGTYTANLCVFSNDPDTGPGNGTSLVIVPVELVVAGPAPAISLAKTVGTEEGVCAATDEITVDEGTVVYYCYEVTNTGNVTLNLHDLVDDQLGTIFTGLNYALTPGSSVNTVAAGLSISAMINVTTTNTAIWTAYNTGPSDLATASASATVNVIPAAPAIEIAKTVGTAAGVCATTDEITVDAGTTVYYCYEVTNTGNVTLNLHDLVDDELGPIFTGLNYALTPGSSVNTVAAGLTISATINVTTTNTATWTAYNAGPSQVATATASATVNVPAVPTPAITIAKTVGTVPGVCAPTSTISVVTGTTVYYCVTVTNTGNVALGLHDLVDSELGTLFTALPYNLLPGASVNTVAAGAVISATITADTTNTATWTAYNAGPTDVATATATATVNVIVFKYYLPIIMKP